jgi:DNA-binding beta-propeller fold protein YncE
MIMLKPGFAASALSASIFVVVASSCSSPSSEAAPDVPFTPLVDDAQPLMAKLHLDVDPADLALTTEHREPQAGPITVTGEAGNLRLVAYAKKLPAEPGLLWVDLFLENQTTKGISSVQAHITSTSSFFNWTTSPLDATPSGPDVLIGGIAAEGVAHFTLGVPTTGKLSFDLALSGTSTVRRVQSSAPLAVSPDGAEVWVTVPDASRIAVLDTARDERIAAIDVPARPESVAITADGALVLVASAEANAITVVDRASRAVLQTLTEADGIAREPRAIVASSDGARAYVSSYVGDRITALERQKSGHFKVIGSVDVGRRPTGLSLSADGRALYVAHFLPRGELADNEAWVSVVSTSKLALDHDALFRDDSNLSESKCLADAFQTTPEKLVFEGAPSQLAGVFLAPNGDEGWLPGIKFAPIPVWEVPMGQQIPGVAPNRFSPPFLFFLDARSLGQERRLPHPGVVDPPDVNLAFATCANLPLEIELATRQAVPGDPNAQLNTGAATPAGVEALTESGISRFVGFTRGGRRALVLSYLADQIAVFDAATHHPTTQHHLDLTGSNPTGLVVLPNGAKTYVAYRNSSFVSVLDTSAYAKPSALPAASWVPYAFTQIPGLRSGSVLTQQLLVRYVEAVPDLPPISETKQVALVDKEPLSPELVRGRIVALEPSDIDGAVFGRDRIDIANRRPLARLEEQRLHFVGRDIIRKEPLIADVDELALGRREGDAAL